MDKNLTKEIEVMQDEITTLQPAKLNPLTKLVGWLILLFTVGSIIILAIVSGLVSYKELAEGGTGMPAGIPLSLQYALALFFATLIALAIIFALTTIYFWKPMKEHLEVRRTNIETAIDATSYAKKAAERNWLEAKNEKTKIKEEARTIIADTKIEADRERRKILDAAKKEQELLVERNREQIEKEKAQLKDDIRNEILSTSLIAAEKIIEKELDAEANQKMVNELLESLK